jgi:snRNA-activating protein complex subunit 3
VSFARGGPLFVPFMVGPISNASGFMHSAIQELQVPTDPTLQLFLEP